MLIGYRAVSRRFDAEARCRKAHSNYEQNRFQNRHPLPIAQASMRQVRDGKEDFFED
jgi:hypothetical protein